MYVKEEEEEEEKKKKDFCSAQRAGLYASHV
jgi:hypothetical protein